MYVASGAKLMNVGTGLPLFVSNNDIWNYDEKERIVGGWEGKAIDRGWNQKDGVNCGWWTAHDGPNQKFTFELIGE